MDAVSDGSRRFNSVNARLESACLFLQIFFLHQQSFVFKFALETNVAKCAWSPKGVQRVLQARVAVLDGRLRDGHLRVRKV